MPIDRKEPPILFVANWDWVLYNFRLPLARKLMGSGKNIVLICPQGKYTQKMQEMGFQWQPWDLNRRSTNPLSEIRAVIDLLKIYRHFSPRATHHFTIKPVVYGSFAARLARVDKVINNLTGLGYLFSDAPKAKFLRIFVVPFLRMVLRGAKFHTAFQNEHDQQMLTSLGIIGSAESTIIPGTGVDTSKFFPRQINSDSSDRTPVIIMAARLLWDKGVAEFVEAARIINVDGVKAQFWLAGEPDHGNPDSVSEQDLVKWRDQGLVEILGHRTDMPELLRQADIAVLPSRYLEGVPLFLLESAASGLALVGSDIEGCRMVITQGYNGMILKDYEPQTLADSLSLLIDNSKLRKQMRSASRKIAEERFEQQAILERYVRLYSELEIIT